MKYMQTVMLPLFGVATLISASCGQESTEEKWFRRFQEVGERSVMPIGTRLCIDELGQERAHELLLAASLVSDHFFYDEVDRFVQIHRGGYADIDGTPLDALILCSLVGGIRAIWYGRVPGEVEDVVFTGEGLNVRFAGGGEKKTIIHVPWGVGELPEPGMLSAPVTGTLLK